MTTQRMPWTAAALVLALSTSVSAAAAKDPAPDQGAELYAENCSVCHGDDGNRSRWASKSLDPPPRDFTRKVIDRAKMIRTVQQGIGDSAMPSFGSQLTDSQIATVVDFIRGRFMPGVEPGNRSRNAINRRIDAPMPRGLSGDPEKGKHLFHQSCTPCHGQKGLGDGPRAYFISPPPRNFQDPADGQILNRQALFFAIKHGVQGRVMPAWGKTYSDGEIADVAEFVFQEFVTPNLADAETAPP